MDNLVNKVIIEGTLHLVSERLQISDTFVKREVIVHVPHESNEKYDKYIPIEFTQGRCDLLDEYQEGESVAIDCDIEGRRWRRNEDEDWRYFPGFKGWRIERLAPATPSAPAQDTPDFNGDDLPF